ncbi:hypothetical protein PHLCEN_2v5133 [Hermanssonia centrifuga]|uniref:Uncharacterized protein n=1 Tax=Hermanssonia centrifuga TaxID=98765 RepID=A0A2R6PBV9_9APHY|nr:hypothetical protein PHLCEN_2v5133 [Hermanssonia centrifuga]
MAGNRKTPSGEQNGHGKTPGAWRRGLEPPQPRIARGSTPRIGVFFFVGSIHRGVNKDEWIVSVTPSTPPPSSVKPNDKKIALDAHDSADDEEIDSSYHSHPARDILPPLLLWAKPEPDAPSRRSEHLEHQRMCGLERVGGGIGNERRNGKILERLESRAKLSAYPSAVQYSAL